MHARRTFYALLATVLVLAPAAAVAPNAVAVDVISSTWPSTAQASTDTPPESAAVRAASESDTFAATASLGAPVPPSADPVRLSPSSLKIMNYYPATAGWSAMWSTYSHQRTDADFLDIATLGANTVRVIIQPTAVGWPDVSAAGAAQLRDMIDTASLHGLSVELTLFDLWYSWSDLAHSEAWASQLLTPYSNDPRIVLVELQNEISTTYPPALVWAAQMLPYLSTLLPGVPRSLSVNTTAALRAISARIPADSLDVVDIHLYGNVRTMPSQIAAARRVANGRPVIIGEAGQTTAGASVGAEQSQLTFYQEVSQLAADSGVGVFAPWILSDFTPDAVPAAFAQSGTEAAFGLRRLDGSWKPAAQVVRDMFAGADNLTFAGSGKPAASRIDYDGDFAREDPVASAIGVLGSWRTFDSAAAASIRVEPAGGPTGAGAVVLAHTGGNPVMVPAVYQQFLLLSGRRSVSVSAEVRLAGGTGFSRVAIAWFNGNSYLGSTESMKAVNGSDEWQVLAVTGRAPRAATSFQIHLKSAYNDGSASFSSVVIS